MSSSTPGFSDREYTPDELSSYLYQVEARVAEDGNTWEDFIDTASQELYSRGHGSLFFGLGDDLDEQLQDRALQTSVALGKLRVQSEEAGRWSGAHKIRAVELMLHFNDLDAHHELESPTARRELHRQVVADSLTVFVDNVKDLDKEK